VKKRDYYIGTKLAGILLCFTLIFYFSNRKVNKELKKLEIEYPMLSPEDDVSGTITSVYHGDTTIFNNDPNQVYLTIDKLKKFRVTTRYDDKKKITIDQIVKAKCKIIKKQGIDTLYIICFPPEDTLSYEFKLLDDDRYPFFKIK
jgi:hypothetical protein